MTLQTEREQVLAFRLESHNLTRRLPAGSLERAAGACGVQNTPPGSAALALLARICDLIPDDIKIALETTKTLLQTWSLRASPMIFPARDAKIFTSGLLPVRESELRHFVVGVQPALDFLKINTHQALSLAELALSEALDGCVRTKDELGIELAKLVVDRLSPDREAKWKSPSGIIPGQSLGETVMRFMLPILALQGLCCHAQRKGNKAYLARTDQWLGSALPSASIVHCRAELVRRYLHCYGPSTIRGFSAWAGIAERQAGESWSHVMGELVQVRYNQRKSWLHEADLNGYLNPAQPAGVHLLPPHDPFLQMYDRTTLVADTTFHQHIWLTSGNPGVVLAGGRFVGIWRPQKKGRQLTLSVELTTTIGAETKAEIDAEAQRMANFRECASAKVYFIR